MTKSSQQHLPAQPDTHQLAANRPKLRGRPRKDQASVIEADIRTAAIELFGEMGFAGAGMEAIAARAGISKRTLYMRYPDKKALFKDVIESILTQSRQPDPPEFSDMAACLAFHVENFFMICNDPDMRVIFTMGDYSAQNPQELTDWAHEFTEEMGIQRIAQTIADTASKTGMTVSAPEFYAASLLDLAMAHYNRTRSLKLTPVEASITVAALRIVRLLLAGMRAEGSEA